MLRSLLAAGLLVSLGCSNDDGPSSTPADATTTPDAAVTGPCPARTLCMKPFLVKPDKPVSAARLTVIWFQGMHVSGLPPMPVQLAYDAPFVPGQPRYDIAAADVKPPSTDSVLVCQWENNTCLHSATPAPVGFGLPVVLDDTNANGTIDPSEITFYFEQGIGMAYFAWSQSTHPPGDETLYKYGSPTYLGDIFTQSIAAGVHVYPLVDTGSFDVKLGPPDTTQTPDLALCPGHDTSCSVAPPRLVGFDNP